MASMRPSVQVIAYLRLYIATRSMRNKVVLLLLRERESYSISPVMHIRALFHPAGRPSSFNCTRPDAPKEYEKTSISIIYKQKAFRRTERKHGLVRVARWNFSFVCFRAAAALYSRQHRQGLGVTEAIQFELCIFFHLVGYINRQVHCRRPSYAKKNNNKRVSTPA